MPGLEGARLLLPGGGMVPVSPGLLHGAGRPGQTGGMIQPGQGSRFGAVDEHLAVPVIQCKLLGKD